MIDDPLISDGVIARLEAEVDSLEQRIRVLREREQRWAAEQRAAELLVTVAVAAIMAKESIAIAEAENDSEIVALRAEVAELKAMIAAAGDKP